MAIRAGPVETYHHARTLTVAEILRTWRLLLRSPTSCLACVSNPYLALPRDHSIVYRSSRQDPMPLRCIDRAGLHAIAALAQGCQGRLISNRCLVARHMVSVIRSLAAFQDVYTAAQSSPIRVDRDQALPARWWRLYAAVPCGHWTVVAISLESGQ